MPNPTATLFRNLLLLRSAYILARQFPKTRFILIKGAALFTIFSNNNGHKLFSRPMEDVDIVVDTENDDEYEIFISHLNNNDIWQKIPSDPQSFYLRKDSTTGFNTPFMGVIDIHKNFWYVPDKKLNKEIINRSQRITDDDVPPNLFRLSPEDLWIDIAIHSSFHHTLKPADRKEDINFLESAFTIDKEIIEVRLNKYFGKDISQAILENFCGKTQIPTIKSQLYKKFIASDFPAKGFIARYFFASGGFIRKLGFMLRNLLFPSKNFIARRYDTHTPLQLLFYRLTRPFILIIRSIYAFSQLITQNLSAFKRKEKNFLKNIP